MPPRPELQQWLRVDFPGWSARELAGDASTRRFFRLSGPGAESRILMDYGRRFSGETDDVVLSRIFREAGLPVAEVVGVVPDPGCLVLEDLGDRLLEQVLLEAAAGSENAPPAALLDAAVLAAEVVMRGTPVLSRSGRAQALDAPRFRLEMDFFLEHYVVGVKQRSAAVERLRAPLHRLADLAAESSAGVLCHRDFHSRNLLVREDGSLAMVDIQDARWGPDSYDLASLLYDAYADIDPPWIDAAVDRFLEAWDDAPPVAVFRRRLELVAALRMIKALGTFGFQQVARGTTRYHSAARRTLVRLRSSLPGLDRPCGLWSAFESTSVLD